MPFKSKPDADRGVQRQIRIAPELIKRFTAEAARMAEAEPDRRTRPGWTTALRECAEAELRRRERKAGR